METFEEHEAWLRKQLKAARRRDVRRNRWAKRLGVKRIPTSDEVWSALGAVLLLRPCWVGLCCCRGYVGLRRHRAPPHLFMGKVLIALLAISITQNAGRRK
jgi:hypothetical protein